MTREPEATPNPRGLRATAKPLIFNNLANRYCAMYAEAIAEAHGSRNHADIRNRNSKLR